MFGHLIKGKISGRDALQLFHSILAYLKEVVSSMYALCFDLIFFIAHC